MLCVTIPFFRKCCRKLVKMRLTVIQHGERMWQEEVRKEVEKAGQNENAHQRDVACLMNCVLRWDKARTHSHNLIFLSNAILIPLRLLITDYMVSTMYFPFLLSGRGLWMMPVCPKGLLSLRLTNQKREKISRGWDSLSNRNLALRKRRERKKAREQKNYARSFLFADLLTLWHCNWIIIIIAVNNISNKPYYLFKADWNLAKLTLNVLQNFAVLFLFLRIIIRF